MNVRTTQRLVIVMLSACLTAGCAAAPADAVGCTVQFTGNTPDQTSTNERCAELASKKDAGVDADADAGASGVAHVLTLQANSRRIAQLSVTLTLSGALAAGTYSSQTSPDWNVIGAFESRQACVFEAGSDAVPRGSFQLTLSAVPESGDNRTQQPLHGLLELTSYVHAPPGTDCGAGDVEAVTLSF